MLFKCTTFFLLKNEKVIVRYKEIVNKQGKDEVKVQINNTFDRKKRLKTI